MKNERFLECTSLKSGNKRANTVTLEFAGTEQWFVFWYFAFLNGKGDAEA